MELTVKHRAFAEAVLAGMKHREAAIAAGYSERTAGPQGSRLAKRPDIADFIKKYKKAGASKPPPPPKAPPAPKFDVKATLLTSDPLVFLTAAMNDPAADPKLRVEAAKALMPFVHARKGEGGKKEASAEAAKKAANKFATPAAPGLKRVK